MRSLKIIIFRDTDKPYTMILSSSLIIGLAFGSIAVLSLFTFSVMSNVMLVTNGHQQTVAVEESQTAAAMPEESVEDKSGGEDLDKQPDQTATSGAEEDDTPQPEPEESDEQTAEEMQPIQEETSETTAAEDVITQFNENADVEVILYNDIELRSSSIYVPLRVRKSAEPGVTARGRFIAALVHKDGSLGPSYPEVIQFDGTDPLNPQRGTPFRIQYMRDYDDVIFTTINPDDYTGIAVFLYDQNGSQLIWRSVMPITR